MGRSSTHSETQTAQLYIGNDCLDIGIVIGFTFHPAEPATPPSYDSGGDPPEGELAEIDSVAFVIDGKPVALPAELADWLRARIDHAELCGVAHDERAAREDEAADLARERMRDEGF